MWLSLIVAALAVVGIAGGILSGFAFTLIMLPIAAIVLIAGLAYGQAGRVIARRSELGSTGASQIPTSQQREPGRVPTSPERLADARRAQQ
jgi:hypothetical protein